MTLLRTDSARVALAVTNFSASLALPRLDNFVADCTVDLVFNNARFCEIHVCRLAQRPLLSRSIVRERPHNHQKAAASTIEKSIFGAAGHGSLVYVSCTQKSLVYPEDC
jgi:hypothetical protein